MICILNKNFRLHISMSLNPLIFDWPSFLLLAFCSVWLVRLRGRNRERGNRDPDWRTATNRCLSWACKSRPKSFSRAFRGGRPRTSRRTLSPVGGSDGFHPPQAVPQVRARARKSISRSSFPGSEAICRIYRTVEASYNKKGSFFISVLTTESSCRLTRSTMWWKKRSFALIE